MPSPHVVLSSGSPQQQMELRGRFDSALSRAGLKRIRFHDLRHTFGTLAAGSGEDLVRIQAWVGHAHIGTTMIYTHYQPAKDDAKRLSEAFRAESGPPVAGAVAV